MHNEKENKKTLQAGLGTPTRSRSKARTRSHPYTEGGRGIIVAEQVFSLLAGGVLNLEFEKLLKLHAKLCTHTCMNVCVFFPQENGP